MGVLCNGDPERGSSGYTAVLQARSLAADSLNASVLHMYCVIDWAASVLRAACLGLRGHRTATLWLLSEERKPGIVGRSPSESYVTLAFVCCY